MIYKLLILLIIFSFQTIIFSYQKQSSSSSSRRATKSQYELSSSKSSETESLSEIESSSPEQSNQDYLHQDHVSSNALCRTEWGFRSPYQEYSLDTCAKCYKYMPDNAFLPNSKYNYVPLGQLSHPITNQSILSNETRILSQTFISVTMFIKWHQCCLDALQCCIKSLQYKENNNNNDVNQFNYCPRTWDGWSCWDKDAVPGSTLSQSCPKHIYWHSAVPPCRGYVTKQCNSSGEWYKIHDREWSNYSNCARDDIFIGRIQYSIITNIISIFCLVPALIIFGHYKQLTSVSRIRLHKHLFTSLLLHAIVNSLLKWHILNESQSNQEPQPGQHQSSSLSSIYCLTLSLLQRYFRSTTYLWMFNEALYLHQLIKNAFTQPPLLPLICLAYILPLITTTFYIITRAFSSGHSLVTTTIIQSTESPAATSASFMFDFSRPDQMSTSINNHYNVGGLNDQIFDGVLNVIDKYEDASSFVEDDKCWLMPSRFTWHEWVINAPNLAILVVNCVFLILLLRVLCIKASSSLGPSSLRSPTANHQPSHHVGGVITRQSVMVSLRAAVLLLPLYGLHYLVIVYRPNTEICWLSEFYHYLSLTLDGLQGCVVSIIFCFANHEIRYLLTRTFERVSSRQRSTTIYLTEINPTQQH